LNVKRNHFTGTQHEYGDGRHGGTAAAAPPPSGLATLPSVGAVP